MLTMPLLLIRQQLRRWRHSRHDCRMPMPRCWHKMRPISARCHMLPLTCLRYAMLRHAAYDAILRRCADTPLSFQLHYHISRRHSRHTAATHATERRH